MAPVASSNSAGGTDPGIDGDAIVAAEGIGKQYPRIPVTLFRWSSRSSTATGSGASPPRTRTHSATRRPGRSSSPADSPAPASTMTTTTMMTMTKAAPARTAWSDTGPTGGDVLGASRRLVAGPARPGPRRSRRPEVREEHAVADPRRSRVSDRGQGVRPRPRFPLPDALTKALALTDKGGFSFDIAFASKLLGIEGRLIKRYEREIDEITGPLEDRNGQRVPGALSRLAIAAAAVLPANLILLEDNARGLDPAFIDLIVERVQRNSRTAAP